MYYLGIHNKKGLYQIDLVSRTLTLISSIPMVTNEFDAVLIRNRPDSEDFVIVMSVQDGSWHFYSSKTNTWKPLPKWKITINNYIHSYLVYVEATKTFYYHVNGCDTWEAVQI